MIDKTSFENAVKKYLDLVIKSNNDLNSLVWNCDTEVYENWKITDIEDVLEDFGCDGNRLTMWLKPNEAKHLYEQRQKWLGG